MFVVIHAYTNNRTNSNVWIYFKTLKTNCIELDTASGLCEKIFTAYN